MNKIEKVKVAVRRQLSERDPDAFRSFCQTLAKLKPGESFVVERLTSSERLVVTAFQHGYGRHYATNQEAKGVRVGRLT